MTGPYTTPLLFMAGDIHPNPGHTPKYPCPVCARDVTSRGVSYRCTRCTGWVHAKCSGHLNAAQYRRNKDWPCDPCSASKTQQSTPPPPSPSPTPAPSAEQISDDSTFNVLQFNGNGIGNKLTVLEQAQSGGYTGVKALVKIQEPLHPELQHST